MLYEEFLKNLGFRLKMRRIQLKMTQAQLGEKVEISENRISEIESGRCNITLKSLYKLFDVLNIDFFEVFKL